MAGKPGRSGPVGNLNAMPQTQQGPALYYQPRRLAQALGIRLRGLSLLAGGFLVQVFERESPTPITFSSMLSLANFPPLMPGEGFPRLSRRTKEGGI